VHLDELGGGLALFQLFGFLGRPLLDPLTEMRLVDALLGSGPDLSAHYAIVPRDDHEPDYAMQDSHIAQNDQQLSSSVRFPHKGLILAIALERIDRVDAAIECRQGLDGVAQGAECDLVGLQSCQDVNLADE